MPAAIGCDLEHEARAAPRQVEKDAPMTKQPRWLAAAIAASAGPVPLMPWQRAAPAEIPSIAPQTSPRIAAAG